MNAIVGLCHFCEAHGPCSLFCTFTTHNEEHTTESAKSPVQCNGCTSLGNDTVLVSKDEDGSIYCSRESVPNADVTAFLKQAAIRSITCEVSWSKSGGVVYFSDPRGHVLSLMFQLADTRARGLKRWFSVVVLMKDKMLLLNITPLLSEHMQKIANELQEQAEVTFNEEQKVCSQRALRLRTGRNDFGQSRSLTQLTGNEDIFKHLHTHFTFMLKAGALNYTETLYTSQSLLKKFDPKSKKGIFEDGACFVPDEEESISIRSLEKLLTKNVFRIMLYCTLTGVDIVVRTSEANTTNIVTGLSRFQPVSNYKDPIHIRKGIRNEPNVPESPNTCILEETGNSNFVCKWAGALPTKCPTLMTRIESAIANPTFNDAVLKQHLKCLLMEWLGIAKTIKSAIDSSGPGSDAVAKLSQVLGTTSQDEPLMKYWIRTFCN